MYVFFAALLILAGAWAGLVRLPSFARLRVLRRPLTIALSGTGLVMTWVLGLDLSYWYRENGWNRLGLCPGPAPDGRPRLCTFGDYLLSSPGDSFGAAVLLMFSGIWMAIWCGSWFFLRDLKQNAGRHLATRERIWSAIVAVCAQAPGMALLVIGLSIASGSLAVVLSRTLASQLGDRSHRRGTQISFSSYVRAWGLPPPPPKHASWHVVIPRDPAEAMELEDELAGEQTARFLSQWPSECWQLLVELPSWLRSETWRADRPPLSDASVAMFDPLHDRPPERTLTLFGVRLGPRRAPPEAATWATSFEEAARRIEAGEHAWQWFAISLVPMEFSENVRIRHRGYSPDLRRWPAICQGDGSAIRALAGALAPRGRLQGIVEVAPSPGERKRLVGAILHLARRDSQERYRAVSGEHGLFELPMAVGRYDVVIEHPDYDYTTATDCRVSPGRYSSRTFVLKPPRPPATSE